MSQLFRVYIDETGDRGTAPASSPFFCFAAVVVNDGNDHELRRAHARWCTDLQKPLGTNLHWRDNLKYHHQRRYAAHALGALPVRLSFVIVHKASLPRTSYIMSNSEAMYLWAARLLLERLSWMVRDQQGEAILSFGAVKGFSKASLDRYIANLRNQQNTQIAWPAIRPTIRMVQAGSSVGVQLADLACGALDSAIRPQLGQTEPAYLQALAPIVYKRRTSSVLKYGMKVVGNEAILTGMPWWAAFEQALVPMP